MLRLFCLLVISLITTSCGGPRYVDFFPCYDNGVAKPRVAMLPVFDCANSRDDVAEQITNGIRYMSMHHGDLFFLSKEEVDQDLSCIGNVNYFGHDLSFAKGFRGANYVAILELIENQYIASKCSLVMKVRIRIIDIRCEKPVIVLQEVFNGSYRGPGDKQACQHIVIDIVNKVENVLWSIH